MLELSAWKEWAAEVQRRLSPPDPGKLGLSGYAASKQRRGTKVYRVIHKSLRDFRSPLRNNQDRHGRKEDISR